MKELCHKNLARLVGLNGTIQIPPKYQQEIEEFSIEPDELNRKEIAKSLIKNLSVPMTWLIDHTIRAKEMAIHSLQRAKKEKKDGSEDWVRYLGWAFHYITDWATPHHSPISKSNPVLVMSGLGALFGGILGGLSEARKKDKKEYIKGIAKGSLIGAGVMGAAGSIDLAINHNKFENECDRRWKLLKFDVISSAFESEEILLSKEMDWKDQLDKFKELMNSLRAYAEGLPPEWIDRCTENEFIDYMVEIAKVMDIASQMVMLSV
jgi:hypothetical protein